MQQVFLRFYISPVHIDHIAQRLERIKRYSNREYNIKRLFYLLNACFFKNKIYIKQKKIKVFKKYKKA